MFRFSFKKARPALFSGGVCVRPCAHLCVLCCVREGDRERATERGGESCKRKQSAQALEVYNLCNLSVEMNWVIYWKTQSQEDWISTAYPRAPIHQVPINNLTIEF